MSERLPVHSLESAPESARDTLRQAAEAYGFLPNLMGMLATSPAALEGYATLSRLFADCGLDATERHVVVQAHNVENGCAYCAPAHSAIAREQGVDADLDESLRRGEPLDNDRLEALRQFTLAVVRERGRVSAAKVEAFLDHGYEAQAVLEVILGVAMKTLSNCANHIAGTPLDEAFEDRTPGKDDNEPGRRGQADAAAGDPR